MRTRPHQVTFHCNDEELYQLRKNITFAGLTQQEYLLQCAILEEKNFFNTDGLKQLTQQLIPQISRVGNNLNQIAKQLNTLGYVNFQGELSTALKGCDETWQLIKSLIQKQV